MTHLNKPLRRITDEQYQHRPIIIQIEPADTVHNKPTLIRLKEKGRRLWYEIPLMTVYTEAAKRYGERQRKEKLIERARRGVKTAQEKCRKGRIKF